MTNGNDVIALGTAQNMGPCSIEEADARVIVHMVDAIRNGFNRLCVRTVDSDLVYIIIGQLDRLLAMNSQVTVAIAFGTGKNYHILNINDMALSIPKEMGEALPAFHAFSGCDTASFFF